MNALKHLLMTALASVMAFTASAQFVSGPATGAALGGTPIAVTTATTNFSLNTTQSRVIPIGKGGVGLQMTIYGIQSGSTTNFQMLFQGSLNGSDWIDTPLTASAVQWVAAPSGTTVYNIYTNFMPNAVANQNIGNLRYIRATWMTNGNGTNWLYISNLTWSVMQ